MGQMGRKFERLAAYLPLGATAIVLLVQNFFQDFLTSFKFSLALATVAISFLLVTWFLETRITRFADGFKDLESLINKFVKEQPRMLEAASSNFRLVGLGDGFRAATAAMPDVTKLRVFAATGSQMHTFIQHSRIRIDTCLLLVQQPPPEEVEYSLSIDQAVERWKYLVHRGTITHLEVVRYTFQPTEYQCLFDESVLLHGLFDPNPMEDSGLTVREPVMVNSESITGSALIASYVERYDTLFNYWREITGSESVAESQPTPRERR